MMRALLLAAVMVVGSGVRAQESGVDIGYGNGLLQGFNKCDQLRSMFNNDDPKIVVAIRECSLAEGYTQGIVSHMNYHGEFNLPNHVTIGQIYDVVKKYLTDHPESRNQPSVALVETAVKAAWGKP